MTESLLDVRGLRLARARDGVPILREVSFAIGRRRAAGLIGISGSGKSLTAKAVTGLLPRGVDRTGGRVLFDGVDITQFDRQRAVRRGRDIGMISQNPLAALTPVLTVGEQLVEGLQAHRGLSRGAAAERARAMLAQVGLGESAGAVFESYPHMLSGGMAQRVVIAMVLLPQPAFVIADEPTTALDVTTQYRLLRLLADLRHELELTMLLISHDLAVVSNFCDEVHVLRDGVLVESGETARVFSAPVHPYTQELIRASRFAEGVVFGGAPD